MIAATALLLVAQAATAAPRNENAVAALADSFAALCLDGHPDQEESARRALAAGWKETASKSPTPSLPPGQRLSVMQREAMIFVTMPPTTRSPDMLGCEVGINLDQSIPLDELASAVGLRLRLGPAKIASFGGRLAAFWRPDPHFALIASTPPAGNGPRTYILLARRDLEPTR